MRLYREIFKWVDLLSFLSGFSMFMWMHCMLQYYSLSKGFIIFFPNLIFCSSYLRPSLFSLFDPFSIFLDNLASAGIFLGSVPIFHVYLWTEFINALAAIAHANYTMPENIWNASKRSIVWFACYDEYDLK